MRNAANRLSLSFLDSNGDQTARNLVSGCLRNDFLLTPEIGRFSEQLVLLDGNPLTLNSPRILWGGSETLASTEFEFDWPRTPISPKSVFSSTYRQITAAGYQDCIHQTKVVIEHIECVNAVVDGSLPVSYVRALIPITNGQGAWFIGVYSFNPQIGQYPKASAKAERFRRACTPRNTSLHMPYSSETSPK